MSETKSTETALAAIARIRRLIERLPSLGADGEWLAAVFERYLEGAKEGQTMDQVIGIATPRGGRPWWRIAEKERQRVALQQLASAFSPDPGVPLAVAVEKSLARYRAGRWKHDRIDPERTTGDQLREAMQTVLAVHGGASPSKRTIERALAATRDRRSAVAAPVVESQHEVTT